MIRETEKQGGEALRTKARSEDISGHIMMNLQLVEVQRNKIETEIRHLNIKSLKCVAEELAFIIVEFGRYLRVSE